MGFTVSIVYPRLVSDGKGDTAMYAEALPRTYVDEIEAATAGMFALRRLRGEGKQPSHYLIHDGDGKPLAPAAPL